MNRFPSIEWFHDLKEKVNADADFQKAARWFKGTIGWEAEGKLYGIQVSEGRVEAVEREPQIRVFTMAGDLDAWEELFARGTINRLFRQSRIRIQGDRVEAMRYWKVLWYLTEAARKTN